jgi:hypothetical protein
MVEEYLLRGRPRKITKTLGRPKKESEANTEHILVSRETKERLEILKDMFKEPLGNVVLRLTKNYFIDD